MVVGSFRLECELGAWHEANGNVRVAYGGEAGGEAIESVSDQFVSDLGRPGRNIVQAIIAHPRYSSWPGGAGPGPNVKPRYRGARIKPHKSQQTMAREAGHY